MPQLDVSFMTTDPMLSDVFDVVRRIDAVDNRGRAQKPVDRTFQGVRGVVTQGDSELIRAENGQTMTRTISVATPFAIIGPALGPASQGTPAYQPDIIRWDGTDYIVTSCLPYSRFGAGTFQVTAASMSTVDRKPGGT